ncbi:MAG: GHKL domain-containing protein [Clostridia bacterium]|nr:GHKL domain-containing protein [Clostridia bacterium]
MNSVGFVLLSFSVLGMAVVRAALLALRLKLSEPVSHALLFGSLRIFAVWHTVKSRTADAGHFVVSIFNIRIKYSKGTLIILIKNNFDGKPKLIGDRYQTTKENTKLHGIGLQSIETTIQKYHGEMITKHNDSEFSVKILVFL